MGFDELADNIEPKAEGIKQTGEQAPQSACEGMSDSAEAGQANEDSESPETALAIKQAAKILGKVSFAERLLLSSMVPQAGDVQEAVFSLQEIVTLLDCSSSKGLITRPTGFMGYVDLMILAGWVEHIFGDADLARDIKQKVEEGRSYTERAEMVRQVIEEKLNLCRKLVEEAPETQQVDANKSE